METSSSATAASCEADVASHALIRTRAALDDLFSCAHQYRSSQSYLRLMEFVGRFRFYSPFNAMLIHIQMPGAAYVAPANRWQRKFGRAIKAGARPIVMLQPMGPVLFVFDVGDTEPLPGAPPLPPSVTDPFAVRSGSVGAELEQTIANAKRDGVNVIECLLGAQRAGSIAPSSPGHHLELAAALLAPRRYDLVLNSNLSREAGYTTLVHELGHLYCGHLGTPNAAWWPDRRGMKVEIKEFEAESVCYLVCTRRGIDNPSAEYLAGYVREFHETPPISLDALMKAACLIERMGQQQLPPRNASEISSSRRAIAKR